MDGKVGLGCYGFIGSSLAMNLMTETRGFENCDDNEREGSK